MTRDLGEFLVKMLSPFPCFVSGWCVEFLRESSHAGWGFRIGFSWFALMGVLCNLGVLMNMWAAEDLCVYAVFGWCAHLQMFVCVLNIVAWAEV